MHWGRKYEYQYAPYDPNDEVYFGSRKVVHAEWDYIYKRRANQEAAEEEKAVDTEMPSVDVLIPQSNGQGGLLVRFIRIFNPRKGKRSGNAQSTTESEPKNTKQSPPPDLCGIALSGGGIRSASFCLGILQVFAYAGWLKKLDYMSTVSGGGYIGGSVSWLLHKTWKGTKGEDIPYGLARESFPYGSYPMVGMSDKGDKGSASKWDVYKGRMLRHLRQHARYLTPGNGINLMSLFAVMLRNTLFSLFVYGGSLVVIFAAISPWLFKPVECTYLRNVTPWQLDWCTSYPPNRPQMAAVLVAFGFLAVAIVYVLAVTLLRRIMSTGYQWRYYFELLMGRVLTLVLFLTVIGFVPVVSNLINKSPDWINKILPSKMETSAIKSDGQVINLGEASLFGNLKDKDGHTFAVEGQFKVTMGNNKADATLSQNVPKVAGETSSPTPTPVSSKVAAPVEGASNVTKQNNQAGNVVLTPADKKASTVAALVGGISTIFGAISSFWAFVQEGRKKKKIPTSVIVAVATITLIFGLLLLGYHFGNELRIAVDIAMSSGHVKSTQDILLAVSGVLLLFFLRWPNLNYLSIHRYYRDRLMETFTPDLPDAVNTNGPVPGAGKSADHTSLYHMLNEQGRPGQLGPYHIINANIVLVSSKIPKFRGRGGDNFILTPKYCGSNATGWCETRHSPYDDMTPPTAIAISGAAVNSNAASGGNGMTRTPWLSFLMGFFNIRLGYWADNPTPQHQRLQRIANELDRLIPARPERNGEKVLAHSLKIARHGLCVAWRWSANRLILLMQRGLTHPFFVGRNNSPNAIIPGVLELYFRQNLDENSRMIQLSDGGHFENLGLYELIRRRLKLIIVCDGTADSNFSFEDLANAMEKVRSDFGAIIDLDCQDMELLSPRGKAGTGAESDKRVGYAAQGYLIGKITYNDRNTGTLIYLKTAFFKELSADIYGYRKTHDEFPHQPTSDQFFDEKQFEAYREFGFQVSHKMMCDDKVQANADVMATLGKPDIRLPEKWRQTPNI
jgi:hypothetical protein